MLGPCNRRVARKPLCLVHIRLDQAHIDRERFASDEPGRNAYPHHALEYAAQGIALAEAFVPRSTEYRMIGHLVFDPEFAKPPVGQVDLDLSTKPPLRAERTSGLILRHACFVPQKPTCCGLFGRVPCAIQAIQNGFAATSR